MADPAKREGDLKGLPGAPTSPSPRPYKCLPLPRAVYRSPILYVKHPTFTSFTQVSHLQIPIIFRFQYPHLSKNDWRQIWRQSQWQQERAIVRYPAVWLYGGFSLKHIANVLIGVRPRPVSRSPLDVFTVCFVRATTPSVLVLVSHSLFFFFPISMFHRTNME